MNQLETLTELEQDAIAEVFNIGVGKAGAALSEMVSKEVYLSIPRLSITTLTQANQLLSDGNQSVSGVRECFDGAVAGNALVLFPQDRILEFVSLLLPPGFTEDQLLDLEEDTIIETGNIILNAIIGSLSDILQEELSNKMPQTFSGSIHHLAFCDEVKEINDQNVLKLDMEMTVKDIEIQGNISFLIIIKSVDSFKDRLTEYFGLA